MDELAVSDSLGALAAPFTVAPERAVLLFDFDGTLAPIVDDPPAARALPESLTLLAELAGRYRRVAAVSGRERSFLTAHLPASVDLSGLYGLESRIDGIEADHPDADSWRGVVAAVAARAEVEGPKGMRVESKGLSITLHYRTAPEAADAVHELAARLGAETGLDVRAAKMSVELHPPIEADKGHAVRQLVGDADAVLYAGDDIGDLPAFAALAAMAAEGRTVARVAIGGPELPAALAAAADLVLADASRVPELLRALLPGVGGAAAS